MEPYVLFHLALMLLGKVEQGQLTKVEHPILLKFNLYSHAW